MKSITHKYAMGTVVKLKADKKFRATIIGLKIYPDYRFMYVLAYTDDGCLNSCSVHETEILGKHAPDVIGFQQEQEQEQEQEGEGSRPR